MKKNLHSLFLHTKPKTMPRVSHVAVVVVEALGKVADFESVLLLYFVPEILERDCPCVHVLL